MLYKADSWLRVAGAQTLKAKGWLPQQEVEYTYASKFELISYFANTWIPIPNTTESLGDHNVSSN